MKRIIMMIDHGFEERKLVLLPFQAIEARHHAHHPGRIAVSAAHIAHIHTCLRRGRGCFLHSTHLWRRLAHLAHWHCFVIHVIPGQQPIVHLFDLWRLRVDNVLARLQDSIRLCLLQTIVCHVEGHLMMIAHAFHKAHFSPTRASGDRAIGERRWRNN